MDYKNASVQELMERRSAIMQELETADDAKLTELETEARAIKEELETRKAAEQKRAAIRDAVAQGEGEKTKEFRAMPEKKTRTVDEIRSSQEYIDAFAKYIRTEDPRECRTLVTNTVSAPTGGSNTVPVPIFLEERIRHAWEENDLLSLVNKTYVRGNLRVGFERFTTGAVLHYEGTAAPEEEQLILGVVTLVPRSIKKWIRISDEALDMGSREFLEYIYDEITARIIEELRGLIINTIKSADNDTSASAIGVPSELSAVALDAVAKADALLSSGAKNVAVIMNRATKAAFVSAMAANGYMFDPFAGYKVIYDSHVLAYDEAADAEEPWLIVGDLSAVQVNFPNGDDVKLKYDDLSEAEADLIKIVGRLYAAIGITAPGKLARVYAATT